MESIMVQSYVCEVCGKTGTEDEIAKHEIACREQCEKQARKETEYSEAIRDRLQKAIAWARSNEPVLLLISRGFVDEARVLCRDWAQWNLWDCGTSSGWESVYDAMVAAAREKGK